MAALTPLYARVLSLADEVLRHKVLRIPEKVYGPPRAAAAEAEAKKNNWTMVIVIVDDGGNLMYLQKMDGTQIGSIQVAQDKAMTAIRFKRTTKALEDTVAGGRNAVLKLTGAIPVEGGIPLIVEGKLVGAIGASGGSSDQDGHTAEAGAAAVK